MLQEFLAAGGGRFSELEKALAKTGGKIEKLNSPQYFGFLATVPKDGFFEVLPHLCRAIAKPRLNSATANLAREKALASLVSQNTNDCESAEALAAKVLFGDTPLGFDRLGNPFVLERVTENDLATYYREYVTPDNLEIVVSGPVGEREIFTAIIGEMGDYFAAGNKAALQVHRRERPIILPIPPDEEEEKYEKPKEKEYLSPRNDYLIIAARELPGTEGGEALPFALTFSLKSAINPVVASLREDFGPLAISDFGSGFGFNYHAGFAYIWLTASKACAKEAKERLASASVEASEKTFELLPRAAAAAKLYGRDAKSFVQRALGFGLFFSGEMQELPAAVSGLDANSVSNALSKCGAPVTIFCKPESR